MVARILTSAGLLAIALAGAGHADQKATADGLSAYATLAQELDARRRLNVLYPNPQAPRHGVQVGYVHVGTGHLTFKRRDIVLRANGPVAFARLYDSRMADNADFGPGWRLGLAEEVIVGTAATYIDRSGTRHRFLPTGNGYWAAAPRTVAHAGSRLVLEGGQAILHEGDGTVRVFARTGADRVYRIAQVRERARRLDFAYANGRLAAISHAGEALFSIKRDERGRVLAVHDRHGRSVRYGYTAWGSLRTVRDLAGNHWRHEYGPGGRLTKAVGPNGKPYLSVRYDALGRAVESRFGRQYAFAYAHGRTIVTAGTGQVRVFDQDADGITVRMAVDGTVAWTLAPDELGRVRTLRTPARTIEYRYANDAGARVASIIETTTAGSVERQLAYDRAGRLASIEASDGGWTDVAYASGQVRLAGADGDFAYDISPAGAVTSVTDAGGRIDAEYDQHGDLIALSRGDLSVAFERDDLGRIVETRHANGVANRYFYDRLGNRNRVDLGYGGGISYLHDTAGNIVTVEVTELDGTTRRQTTQVGEHNRIEKVVYEDGGTLSVDYDRMGNPVRFKVDGAESDGALEAPPRTHATVSAEYAPNGRLSALASNATGTAWAPEDADQHTGDAELFEDRLAVLLRDASGPAQPSYGPLTFAEETLAPMAADPLLEAIPGLRAARQLHRVATRLLQPGFGPMYAFEKPSNPTFQALELRTTNCCIPCVTVLLCGGCGIGGLSETCYCTSLCYSPFPPGKSVIPSIVERPFLDGRDAFGINTGVVAADTLTCTSACGESYYLGGDVFPSSSWKIQVATEIKLPNCLQSRRTDFNIRNTREHESKHARGYLWHINDVKSRINVLYNTFHECQAEIAAIRRTVDDGIVAEGVRQSAHLDHAGEAKHYVMCENGVTREYECGRGPRPTCPGGNRY